MKIKRKYDGITELVAITVTAWLISIAVVISSKGPGISWDAINHHIYLGWIADSPRFDRDFWAAASQSYQFPYLYWPVYKLVDAGVSATAAGIILASLHVTAIPPLYMLVEHIIPEQSRFGLMMRLIAISTALCSAVVVSLVGATANDLIATVPLLWAIVLGIKDGKPKIASGFLAGISIAFKLSNAPLAIMLPILWTAGIKRKDLILTSQAIFAMVFGYAVTYGYWGWNLFKQFGNPFYPNVINLFG